MASRRTGEANRVTVALTGANLALSVAREAADAVPIVKQVLGAVLRIVGLAEKMDKDREALHALGTSSLQLARQVRAVMAEKTPDDETQAALERILGALDSIEAFMKNHAARSRLRRLLSYAFTVPQNVARLSGELADAVRDLTVVVLLATHAAVQDNARFEGEFRLLRHCEVQKLGTVFDVDSNAPGAEASDPDERALVLYRRAQVDGQLVLVVRYFEGSAAQRLPTLRSQIETIYDRIASHDRIVEELSSIQRSHRNIARIYGWSKGPMHNRFTVFRSGFRPVNSLVPQFANPIAIIIHCAFKLLDAVHHLRLMGVHWQPGNPPYALDDHLEPTIGLRNDLSRIDPMENPLVNRDIQIFSLIFPAWPSAPWTNVASVDLQAAVARCRSERLSNLLARFKMIRRDRHLIPKADIARGHILSDGPAKYLRSVWESVALVIDWQFHSWIWADILLALDKDRGYRLRAGLQAVYIVDRSGQDRLHIHGVDEDAEHIVYDWYHATVPDAQQDGVREAFGFAALSENLTFYLVAGGKFGTYCAPK